MLIVIQYLFPILYLVLKQHLSRFILASTRLLDTNEFECPIMSLNNVFGTVQERVNDLEGMCVRKSVFVNL